MFMGGDRRWHKSIDNYYRETGLLDSKLRMIYKFFYHPLSMKIGITILLIASIYAVFLSVTAK